MTQSKSTLLILASTASVLTSSLVFANTADNTTAEASTQSALTKSWNNLWQSTSQQAQTAFDKGDFGLASKLFGESSDNMKNQNWQASSNYKAGNYEESADLFKSSTGQQQNYNSGNALAKSGDLQGALEAYERHLKDNPNDEDAKFNRDLIKKLLDEQKKKDKQDKKDGKKDNDDKKDKQDKDKSDNQNSQDKQDSKDKKDSKDGEQEKKDKSKEQNDKKKGDEQSEEDKKSKEKDDKEGKEDKAKDGKEQKGDEKKKEAQSIKNTPKPLDQATEQTLRRVPDDSSGLLRARIMQYYREQQGR